MTDRPQHEGASPRMNGDDARTPTGERFPRARRLRSGADFQRVHRGRHSATGSLMVVKAARQEPALVTGSRAGFTVSRKVGNAVTRNLARRRLREQMRRRLPRIVPGWDIVITARVKAATASYEALGAELGALLTRLGLLPHAEEELAER